MQSIKRSLNNSQKTLGLWHHSIRFFSDSGTGRKRLIIIGSGWGGYSLLKRVDKSIYDVIMVSTRNHFLFTPLLASTTVGTLEFRSITEPIRSSRAFRDPAHFHLAECVGLDLNEKTVSCKSRLDQGVQYNLSYDKLVVACGADPATFNTPGVDKYATFMKEVEHAQKVRKQIVSNFELASEEMSLERRKQLLSFVVVGGGPTGVEFAAELHDFINSDVSRLFPHLRQYIRVSLVEPGTVLNGFKNTLRNYAESSMTKRPEIIRIHDTVKEVLPDSVILGNGDTVPAGLVVWSTGVGPRPLIAALTESKTNQQGRLCIDGQLRLEGRRDEFAIGDCAINEEHPTPPTAQVANRQGIYLAKLLSDPNELSTDPAATNPSPDFKFSNAGMMAYVGGYKALADVPTTPVRGLIAWLMWRSVYLTQLGSWRLRLQVPVDWFKTFFLGRDISRF